MQFAGRHLPVTSPEGSDLIFSIAAPILAGFAVTLLGVLVPLNPPTLVPFREPAMLVVAGAAFLYIACMRYAISARNLRITTEQAELTWPDPDDCRAALAVYSDAHDRLANGARLLFGLACLAFGVAIVLMLVPDDLMSASPLRLLTVLGAVVATAAHLVQMVLTRVPTTWLPTWILAVAIPERVIAARLPR